MIRRWLSPALMLPLLFCAEAALAEVSTDGFGSNVSTLIVAGAVEDPDPIGSLVWQPVRSIPAERMLNPGGYARGDGRPDIAMAGAPVVVWAYSAGADHDIAFSEWDGAAWTPTGFLTSGSEDELDPRVHVTPDGTVHVVWWTAGPVDRVYLSVRAPGSQAWEAPLLVGAGRRPAIETFAGGLVVAFERDSTVNGMAQDVAVATAQPGGGFTLDVIGSTARADRLDVQLHVTAGRTWADWKHGQTEFACAEKLSGGWTAIAIEPWTDQTWIGVEATRKAVRISIFN